MHGSLPPIVIDGPDHPHAFDGIPIDRRPDDRHQHCPVCKGHGAWNAVLHVDSGRCRIQACDRCDGSGWIGSDESRTIDDIVMVDGHPAWVRRIEPRTLPDRRAA